ncbi:MAG: hypothetical protein P4L11_13635 [Geothrix sp.]|nr:hypothetical protein [Geothrix sp.]
MTPLLQAIRHALTGKDNTTWDLGRISWASSFLAVVGHEALQQWKGKGSSVRDFAIALAAVAAAHGAALGLKGKTEPDGGAQ